MNDEEQIIDVPVSCNVHLCRNGPGLGRSGTWMKCNSGLLHSPQSDLGDDEYEVCMEMSFSRGGDVYFHVCCAVAEQRLRDSAGKGAVVLRC